MANLATFLVWFIGILEAKCISANSRKIAASIKVFFLQVLQKRLSRESNYSIAQHQINSFEQFNADSHILVFLTISFCFGLCHYTVQNVLNKPFADLLKR